MHSTMRGFRSVAVWLVAGALATGPAALAETNWDALSAADWSGKQADDHDKIAQAGAGGGSGDWSSAIQKAFVGLGMAEPRAECYGKVLAEQLSPEGQEAAAELVGEAASADEVKVGVISGGPEMVGGFSAADVTCPESMGG